MQKNKERSDAITSGQVGPKLAGFGARLCQKYRKIIIKVV
jgi:hypothetical protein